MELEFSLLTLNPFLHKEGDPQSDDIRNEYAQELYKMFHEQAGSWRDFSRFWNGCEDHPLSLLHLCFVADFFEYYNRVLSAAAKEMGRDETVLSTTALLCVVDAILQPRHVPLEAYLKQHCEDLEGEIEAKGLEDALDIFAKSYYDEFGLGRSVQAFFVKDIQQDDQQKLLMAFLFSKEWKVYPNWPEAPSDQRQARMEVDQVRRRPRHVFCKDEPDEDGCSDFCTAPTGEVAKEHLKRLARYLVDMRNAVVHHASKTLWVTNHIEQEHYGSSLLDIYMPNPEFGVTYEVVDLDSARFRAIILRGLWRHINNEYGPQ